MRGKNRIKCVHSRKRNAGDCKYDEIFRVYSFNLASAHRAVHCVNVIDYTQESIATIDRMYRISASHHFSAQRTLSFRLQLINSLLKNLILIERRILMEMNFRFDATESSPAATNIFHEIENWTSP